MTTPTAVDPPGCGCTGCITGQYVPLDRATAQDVAALLRGQLPNHTGTALRVTVVYALNPGGALADAVPDTVRVDCQDLSWDLEPWHARPPQPPSGR
ncbi:hypothetical protein ACFVIM_34275 [Streptomyces sp. NPDC057638]|uniref:hypothetical protein n=1 Tax=Streptomyces sp. NPDC057638 TaxID=3346190 RepID=UPI0036C46B12